MSSVLHVDIPRLKGKSVDSLIREHGEKKNLMELHTLLENTDTRTLLAILKSKLGRNDSVSFWSYLLEGLSFGYSSRDILNKRFSCVQCMLEGLQKVELRYKLSYDIIIRLCQYIPTFPSDQLITILELCIDGIRMGDRKFVCWKDLLPDVLNVLSEREQVIKDGIQMDGYELRENIIRSLMTMPWPKEIATPIADMLKELKLTNSEVTVVLSKFGGMIQSLNPTELPALSFQLFSLCTTSTEVITLLLAFEKYFHRFYYKKLFADMQSNSTDYDSIDTYSDNELREAEETILHHLNYCTQFKFGETQMYSVLKNFSSVPDLILTPFMLSSIISLSSTNREPESQCSNTSVLLNFLRNVINNNQHEEEMAKYSVWCRDTLQRKQVNLDYILTVLIDQNKQGQDVITPGLVSMAFTLLKTKNNGPLNSLAMHFFTKFIRKRFIFGKGVVKKLAEWMILEQDQYQFGECLLMLSVADSFTLSECDKTIKYIMESFLWLPGDQSMRMMSFILPLLKLSAVVRDAFIEVLRKAIISCSQDIRTMAIYGFCMILKQLNSSNSVRTQLSASSFCTQHSISTFSLMSQAMVNRPNCSRNFDMLTLEIVGQLRNCLSSNITMKRVLYENLQRGVELNPKLVPHVLQFIDCHFRSFFRVSHDKKDIEDYCILFERSVRSTTAKADELEVQDNIGLLIQLVSHCLANFQQFESEYNVSEIVRLLRLAVTKVINKDTYFEEESDNPQYTKTALVEEHMNFLEGLISYSLLASQPHNCTIQYILPLFKAHCKVSEKYKSYASLSTKQSQKNHRTNKVDGSTIKNLAINGSVVKNSKNPNMANIWDLPIIEKLLRLLHEDNVRFATSDITEPLRSNVVFVKYVLEVSAEKMEALRNEPEYKQLTHSRRTLKYLTDVTKILYERCIFRLRDMWSNFDKEVAALSCECFQQCLQSANAIYKKNFVEIYMKGFDFYAVNRNKQCPEVLHNIIDEFMEEDQSFDPSTLNRNSDDSNSYRDRILHALIQCLEVLYDNIMYEDRLSIVSYSWLFKFCQNYKVKSEHMSLVHKLLFTQRQKTHSGAFFDTIALQLCNIWGAISDELYKTKCPLHFTLKSLTVESAGSYFNYFCQAMLKQIDDVEHFIVKTNNINFKYRIITEDERDMCLSQLRSMERSICSQLLHISNALINVLNACIPLGSSTEQLLKLVMHHYVCLTNLAKHFLSSVQLSQVSLRSTKFEVLLRDIGKSLPKNIYGLITYIEANVIDKEQLHIKRSNTEIYRTKILRETKLLPKIVLHLETFSRFVIVLSKKTESRLAGFLHRGTVHDFRFRTDALKSSVERTLSHSSEISVDLSPDNISEEPTVSIQTKKNNKKQMNRNDGAKTDDEEKNESNCGHSNGEQTTNVKKGEKSLEVKTKLTKKAKSNCSNKVEKKSKRKLRSCESNGEFAIDDDMIGEQTKFSSRRRCQDNMEHNQLTGNEEDSEAQSSPTPENIEVLEHESNRDSVSQLYKNLTKINKKTKKRTHKEIDQIEPENRALLKKRRRCHSAKK
ncbi:Fanconi anemia group I protein isoform X2 [Ceratitis capitata]|nr:Fanconi anemia group I protein isoform X2 [Ceratitis capitata]XP_020716687.1 Fanconi anemia group I protein isoform X2 [Ceratitis capitata]